MSANDSSRAAEMSSRALDRAASVFNGSKSIKASFTTTIDGTSSTGTITIQGDKFRISSKDFSTWYDGKDQWTYSSASNEVNITSPTPEELAQINPFVIISTLKNAYNSIETKSKPGFIKVTLTPKDSRHADIKKVEIVFNEKTSMPSHIDLNMSTGSKIGIIINSISQGNILPASTFIFNKKELPGVEIIDLR